MTKEEAIAAAEAEARTLLAAGYVMSDSTVAAYLRDGAVVWEAPPEASDARIPTLYRWEVPDLWEGPQAVVAAMEDGFRRTNLWTGQWLPDVLYPRCFLSDGFGKPSVKWAVPIWVPPWQMMRLQAQRVLRAPWVNIPEAVCAAWAATWWRDVGSDDEEEALEVFKQAVMLVPVARWPEVTCRRLRLLKVLTGIDLQRPASYEGQKRLWEQALDCLADMDSAVLACL